MGVITPRKTIKTIYQDCGDRSKYVESHPVIKVGWAGVNERIGTKREEMPWIEQDFDEEFRQFIIDFPEIRLPRIYQLLQQYGEGKEIHIFHSREEAEHYLEHSWSER